MKNMSTEHNKDTHNQLSEEVIEHTFSSQRKLLDTIMEQPDVFSAIRLAGEINGLNECKIIGDYEIKMIKNRYKNEHTNDRNHFVKNKLIFDKGKNENFHSHFSKNKFKNVTSNCENQNNENTKNDFISSETQNENIKNKMRDLQKGYMKLLSKQ